MGRTWVDKQLTTAVKENSSLSAVLRAIGLRPGGGNFKLVRGHIDRLGLDMTHFHLDISGLMRKSRSFHEIFCVHSPVVGTKLRSHVLKHGVLPYVCTECENTGTHNGRKLILQLDHINGVHDDARVDNLRFLCPNCHTQTPTYARRKPTEKRHSQPRMATGTCSSCGAPVERLANKLKHSHKYGLRILCKTCAPTVKVPHETVIETFKQIGTYLGTAKKLGISDTLVKRIVAP